MSKPVRCSVATLLHRPGDPSNFAVRRPLDDDHLPGLWGLPAVTLRDGELPEAAIRRIGAEKLGTRIEPVRFVGIRSADRGDYELILMDIEAELVGADPDVHAATSNATRYIDQCWTKGIDLFAEAASRGSLCSQILFDRAGVGIPTSADDRHPPH